MKIKKIEESHNKLLKLKLIQTKIYNKKQYLNNIKIEDIEYRLKKILYIIYKYHIHNKKILFIGSPTTLTSQIKNLLKVTKHILIPNGVWVKGAISNKDACFTHLSKNKKISNHSKTSELLFQLKKSVDLVVILEESNNLEVLNESYISRIPTISINCNFDTQYNKSSYKVPGDFQFINKKILDNFLYSLLIATFKKGYNHKKYIKTFNSIQRSYKKTSLNNSKSKTYFKK